ncbi:pilus assembly protein N-terminal domain-containing protein [Methylobacterium nodulans]|uniref:pilus assembly protein N-terminal domain-containing protein n=1 Tax=Methylobacterium nodulans TaxID=114616 RepID=UPI0018DDA4E1|nr:pilus assembly protein N-terminal domain-containing protein [Methylobacterium nodulans]
MNKSETVTVGQSFNDVLIGSREILDVIPLNERTLYVLGKKIGTTNISLLDAEKRLISVIDVEVGLDTASFQEKVQAGAGSGAIRVRS